MLTKTELKDLFLKYGFRPLKRLGENYLIDGNVKERIIEAAGVLKAGDAVLEIGPGLGALTMDLVKSGASVYAVEKDKKAFAILKDIAGKKFPNLKLFNADILKFDLKAAAGLKRVRVIGNLPYYITTPIIEYLIENRALIESILVTVQREVADRLLSGPGTKDYGSLSCFVQYYTSPAYIRTIKRTSFYPAPEVDSSLIRLNLPRRPSVDVKNEEMLFKVIRGAFNQRRKEIINSLSREAVLGIPKERLEKILRNAGISPSARPETLTLAAFARIANSNFRKI